MKRMIRVSHAIVVGMTLCMPCWASAARGGGCGDTMSNQTMHQSSTLEKQATTPPTSSVDTNDRSPEISQYMDQINKVREEPKSRSSTAEDSESRGPMGEEAVGGAGPSGPSAAPPGGAPGYEGDQPSNQR